MSNTYKILAVKRLVKCQLGRSRRRWEYNVKGIRKGVVRRRGECTWPRALSWPTSSERKILLTEL